MNSSTGEASKVNDSPVTFGSWRKSTRSDSGGNCVEVAPCSDGRIGIRDSKNPDGPKLIFTRAEWGKFIDGVELGEFDDSVF